MQCSASRAICNGSCGLDAQQRLPRVSQLGAQHRHLVTDGHTEQCATCHAKTSCPGWPDVSRQNKTLAKARPQPFAYTTTAPQRSTRSPRRAAGAGQPRELSAYCPTRMPPARGPQVRHTPVRSARSVTFALRNAHTLSPPESHGSR